jgi:predicted ester cyclase
MRALLSNLRLRFLFLVLVALLPALVLLIVSAAEQRDQAVDDARQDAARLASLAAADQQRLIESTRQLLVVLTLLPEVQTDSATCDALLADLNAQFPLYANLGVIAPDGTLVCSAVAPAGPTNLADRVYFQDAIETKDFSVGEYQVGKVTEKPALNCGYPILDEAGNVTGVVYAAIDLATLGQFAAQADLSDGVILTVYDRDGTVLVRQPDEDDLVGQTLVGTPVVDTIMAQDSGVAEGLENGETYLYAFSALGGADAGNAHLSIAIPKSQVVARADQAFNNNLTRLGLVLVVVLVAAWVGGDLLVRRNTEANKALVRRIYDAFNSGGVDLLDEAVVTEFIDHDPMPSQTPGLVGLKQAVGLFRAAFPDGEMTVEEMLADNDKVIARITLRGTQTGEFFGQLPTGRVVVAEGIDVYRITNGKISEGWSRFAPPAFASDEEGFTPAV